MKKLILKYKSTLLYILLAYFTFLLLQITLQYIPFNDDVAFLRIKQHFINEPFYIQAFYIHVYSAIFTVLAGFTQFSKKIKSKFPKVHKYMGWLYIITIVLFAAPSGLFIGLYANGGISSQISFVLLAILWLLFTVIAMQKVIKRKYLEHRIFMIRSFSLTLSAITLRAWKYIFVALFQPKPMDVYIVVAWLGWIFNLLIAEYIIYRIRNKKRLSF